MIAERNPLTGVELTNEGRLILPFGETKRILATSWAQITPHLPEDFNPHHNKFVRDYFRAQLRIKEGNIPRGRRIMSGLVERPGFRTFEEDNEGLLAGVDIAVRGQTNRRDDIGRPIKPAFILLKND